MDQNVFTDVISDSYSPVFLVSGGNKLVVSVDGISDGADIITYACKGVGEDPLVLNSCSWMGSRGVEVMGLESGYELVSNIFIFFRVINCGIDTNLTLKFRTETAQQSNLITE